MISKVLPVTSPLAITSAAAALTLASVGFDGEFGLGVFVGSLLAAIEHDDDQTFGFNLRGRGERRDWFSWM